MEGTSSVTTRQPGRTLYRGLIQACPNKQGLMMMNQHINGCNSSLVLINEYIFYNDIFIVTSIITLRHVVSIS